MSVTTVPIKVEGEVNCSFEQIQAKHRGLIDSLIRDYSLDVLKIMWEKISLSMKQKFMLGEESLPEHEAAIRKKSQDILAAKVELVAKVKALNPKTLGKIGSSEDVINQLLVQRSASELQTLALKEESLASEYETLLTGCKEYEKNTKNAKENRALINHFETAYSKEVFEEVYQAIPAERREAIEKGTMSLVPYIDNLRKKCEAKRATSQVGTIPSKRDLEEFFKKAKVIGYGEGYHGVFFVEGILNGTKQKLVVKASDKPAQETFATELVSSLHVKTPASCLIDAEKDAELFKGIKKTVEKNSEFQDKYEGLTPKQFTVMTYIPGVTLEKLKASDIESSIRDNPDQLYDKVLFEIGQIAAADLLLYYQDRLPVIGGGNLANIMILKNEEGQCVGAVGIDQVASLTTKETAKSSVFKVSSDPFKRVQSLVGKIVAATEEVSQAAKDIFEDALADSVKESLDEDRALQAIQKGIVSGLSKIVTCSEKRLSEIHESLPSSSYKGDQVDLLAYKTMLETIHSSLLS